jgi:hypothetical protein
MVMQRLISIPPLVAWFKDRKNIRHYAIISKNLDIQPIIRALEQNKKVECEIKYKNKQAIITQFHIKPPKHKNRTKKEYKILKEQKEEYLLGGDY